MKTIVFDFDGTLADSFELVLDITHELTGMRRRTEKEITALRRLPLLTAVRQHGMHWWALPKLILLTRRKMFHRMHKVKLFNGVEAMVRDLHQAGYHLLVMSSNRERNVRACLRAHNLENYFDGVYHCSVFHKVGGLRRILRRNQLQPASTYYVGNETLDVRAANKLGLRAVAVTWSGQDRKELEAAQPFALIDKPTEIRRLLSS